MEQDEITRRIDGKYEERFAGRWTAEYHEDPSTGLWTAHLFHHDVGRWMSPGHIGLAEARAAARAYLDQV